MRDAAPPVSTENEEIRLQPIDLILDHYQNPRHMGRLEPVDAVATGGNPGCGDVVTIYLRGGDGRPVELAYEGQGCTISQAAASMVMEMMNGLTLTQIETVQAEPLLDKLGPDIAAARERCATLALNTLKKAVNTLRKQEKEGAL